MRMCPSQLVCVAVTFYGQRAVESTLLLSPLGARNCLGQKFAGMEQKVVISTILRHFSIRPAMERTEFERNLTPEIILRPSEGIPLYFEPRNKL